MAKIKLRTKEQRLDAGKALRTKCSRLSHGKVVLGQGDKRDVVKLIQAQNEDRLENLVPIRHGRMSQSSFAFFRGTAGIQAYDLAKTPTSGIIVQACGDCHLMNFGGFATPERKLAFDINDFDETLAAPFEWDVKRLAASFVVAARWRGFRPAQVREVAVEVAASYRKSMRKRTSSSILEGWYSQITIEDITELVGGSKTLAHNVKKRISEARERTHEQVAHKLTTPHKGLSRIVDQPPLLYHVDKKIVNPRTVEEFFKNYRETLPGERRFLVDQYQVVDVALKVVGVGSVGTRCFIALLLGAPDDPLFLQIKEARASVLAPYVKGPRVKHNGERVVVGQRLMQSASDIFLGWAKGPAGRDFYVRQLRDMKVSADVEHQNPELMRAYATLCGMTLARAHDKAGDAATIAGYLGKSDEFDQAIGDYAVGYANQVERDYAAFIRAIRIGRLKTDLSRNQLETTIR